MTDAVICEPLRTPIGRAGGMFKDVDAASLAVTVLRALMDRTRVDPALVDDVIFGQCYSNGEAPAIGRVVALDAGFPVTVPGMQVDRRCGSSLQAIINAAMQVQTGASELVIAGGTESMSQVEYYSTDMRYGARAGNSILKDRLVRSRESAGGINYPVPGGMLETAENVRREYKISRTEQDEYALRSHQRAVAAQTSGVFDEEIVPVVVRDRKGMETVIDRDEHPRADTSLEVLAALPAVLRKQDPEATVTAGNSSGQNDAAAACFVTTPEMADRLGLRPLGRLVSWAVAGLAPRMMGMGPVPSTTKALERAALSMSDIDVIELNEAFASQVLACAQELKLDRADFERMNVNGSGISLGHPVGATGTRIAATLLRELDRRDGRYGLETMCIGGGQGLAAIFERVG